MTERVATTCRICAVGCGTIVELDGERVVSVIGDTEDPWSAGYTCPKGRAGAALGEDAPLVLVNRRTAQQYNSLHREIVGRGRPAVPSLLVHPADASTRGLVTGGTATVSTAHGSCTAVIEVTDAIRAGVVSLPHGFDEANVNRLIPATSADLLSGMTIVSGVPVDVQPSTPTANAAR